VVKALDRKLLRDLGRMWAQANTIARVLACGIDSFVALRGAHSSIVRQRDAYYAQQRFADVFVHLERAPESMAARIEAIDGVARVHTRIVRPVLVPIEGAIQPSIGQIVTLPGNGEPPLNAPRLRAGRTVEPGRADEVVLLEAFAEAHDLGPGSELDAIIEGTERRLRIVGIAMSPEYVFALGPGSFVNDPARFGVLWMDRSAVAAAFRMEGSFDDVVLSLQPGASQAAVIADIRLLLAPYGVDSAEGRDRQLSNHVLEGELLQLSSYAIVAPAIFLTVAAFLINVVLARTLSLQRAQIATLKALGYRNREIALHYLELIGLILLAGCLLGIGLGDLLGRGMIGLYRPFFRFPDLAFRFDAATLATALVVSLVAGVGGAVFALVRAVRVPPAEAMLPEAPAVYRRPLLERLGLPRMVGVAGRMVVRELFRRPLRTALSCFAISLATGVIISGRFGDDAMGTLFELVFERAQRDDVEVTFTKAMPESVAGEIAHLPGVVVAEGRRAVPVRARVDQRYRDVILVGHDAGPSLRSVPVWPMRPFEPPPSGIAMSRKLAEILDVKLGESVDLEILEGDRRTVRVAVNGVLDDVFGLTMHASLPTLRRLLREEGSVSSVLLTVDPLHEQELLARLADIPRVSSISRRVDAMNKFRDQTRSMWVTMAILTVMGATIAFGVVYNQARIALSTRSRDLASLRVLGFTRREISAVLLGELATYLVVGIPFGFVIGSALMKLIAGSADPETYRLPAHASAATFAFAAVVTTMASAISALVVRRRLDQLDLVSVLKARE
jgi:putative ABC transport system permease protein